MLQDLESDRPSRVRGAERRAIPSLLLLCLLGCGTGTKTTVSGSSPQITVQPSSLSVPVGASASFSVTAVGDPNLTYQWLRDGTAIAAAIGNTYTIGSASASDNGSRFTVTVSDAYGISYSAAATLSIGPRSPLPGDLRFKQVDAASTVNGYAGYEFSDVNGGLSQSFSNVTGTPLSVGPSCLTSSNSPLACDWSFSVSYLPAGQDGIVSGYASVPSSFRSVPEELGTLSSANTVITGMDVETENSIAAFSWMQTDSAAGFDQALVSVPQASFQDAATQEGLRSRVITAVSFDAGVVTYLSYGWAADTLTSYETRVLVSSFAAASNAATTLASNGYIITAVGGSPSRGVVLVGTRVKGDTLPRPLFVSPPGDLSQLGSQGYAVVALLISLDTSGISTLNTWIGEK